MINILLNKIIPMDPNFVILMENINDLGTLLNLKTYWNDHPGRSQIMNVGETGETFLQKTKEYLFPNLYFAVTRFFRFRIPVLDEFSSTRDKKNVINNNMLLKEFRNNLQLFIDICKRREITPILMTQANRMKEKPDPVIKNCFIAIKKQGVFYQDFKSIYDQFNDSIRDVALKNSVLYIDLAREIPQEKEYMFDLVHLTENGSKKVSQIIKREIVSIINKSKQVSKPSHKIK